MEDQKKEWKAIMKRIYQSLIVTIVLLVLSDIGAAQEPEGTATPTPIPFDSTCIGNGIDAQNLLTNGDFESSTTVGSYPLSWSPGSLGLGGILRAEQITEETLNHYVELTPNASIVQTFAQYVGEYTRFQIRFCAVVTSGRIEVYLGGNLRGAYPVIASESTSSGAFVTSEKIPLEIGMNSSAQNRTIELVYVGTMKAYVDNVQLLPVIGSGGDDPTPTPVEPTETPLPQVTPGNTPTFTPTIPPGTATPTPTPALISESVQISANPPMLVVSPDDFASSDGLRKQVLLNFEVVGSNGELIDLNNFDDVRVRITTDVGEIRQFDRSNYQRISDWEDYETIMEAPLYYFPTSAEDQTVRIIIDIRFRTSGDELQEIRGVLPIIQRVKQSSSMVGATGTFNPALNYATGRKPGDRGFRPDLRTNLYFKERLE